MDRFEKLGANYIEAPESEEAQRYGHSALENAGLATADVFQNQGVSALGGAIGKFLSPVANPIMKIGEQIAPEFLTEKTRGEGPVYEGTKFAEEWGPALFGGGKLALMAGKKGMQMAEHVMPESFAKQAIEGLTRGKGHQEIQMGGASNVSNAFERQEKELGNRFELVKKHFGKSSIYHAPLEEGAKFAEKLPGTYRPSKNLQDYYNPMMQELHDIFKGDVAPELQKKLRGRTLGPTLENAHALQNEIGTEVADLSRKFKDLSGADKKVLKQLRQEKDNLNNDIIKGLERRSPTAAKEWQQSRKEFETLQEAYTHDPHIYKLVRKDRSRIVNPKDFSSIFEDAEPKKAGRVIQDIGEIGRKKILAHRLGKGLSGKKAEDILKEYKQLEDIGLGKYVPESFKGQMETVEKRIGHRERAKTIGGGIGGAVAGGLSGIPFAMELGGAAGSFAPWIIKALKKKKGY